MRRLPRLARLLSIGATALSLIIALPGVALAATTPPGGSDWAELFNPLAGQAADGFPVCLDVPGASTSTGVQLQMYHCHGYDSNGGPQRWTFVHISDGSYEIFNQASKLCITPLPGFDPRFGAAIVQEPCGFYPGQEWRQVDVLLHPDFFQLQNDTYTDKCLWASGGAHRNNGLVEITACDNQALEVWGFG
jgi:hypothetical protein